MRARRTTQNNGAAYRPKSASNRRTWLITYRDGSSKKITGGRMAGLAAYAEASKTHASVREITGTPEAEQE